MLNNSEKNIFLTGATGVLGSQLLKIILCTTSARVHLLSRGKNQSEASRRIKDLLSKLDVPEESFKRINILLGSLEDLPGNACLKNVAGSIDEIFHCAATIGFQISLEEGGRINVGGTKNVLKFADTCTQLKKINYISTTFIAGDKRGVFSEDDFDVGQGFNNNYEKTKFDAELLVRNYYKKEVSVLVFRPSVIMGEYLSGRTSTFKVFYEPLHIFSRELLEEVPANEEALHNLIPVDVAAEAIHLLSQREGGRRVFHIISLQNTQCGYFMKFAAQFFSYRNPRFTPLEQFNLNKLSPVQYRLIAAFIPYFNYKTLFLSDSTQKILRKHGFQSPHIDDGYYKKLFEFCAKERFIKVRGQ